MENAKIITQAIGQEIIEKIEITIQPVTPAPIVQTLTKQQVINRKAVAQRIRDTNQSVMDDCDQKLLMFTQ